MSDWKPHSYYIRLHKINHKLMLVVRNFHGIPLCALLLYLGVSLVSAGKA